MHHAAIVTAKDAACHSAQIKKMRGSFDVNAYAACLCSTHRKNSKELKVYRMGSATIHMLTAEAGPDNRSPAFAQLVVHADWDMLGASKARSRTRHAGIDAGATSFCSLVACCRQQ